MVALRRATSKADQKSGPPEVFACPPPHRAPPRLLRPVSDRIRNHSGIAIMLLSFGPSVLLLFRKRMEPYSTKEISEKIKCALVLRFDPSNTGALRGAGPPLILACATMT